MRIGGQLGLQCLQLHVQLSDSLPDGCLAFWFRMVWGFMGTIIARFAIATSNDNYTLVWAAMFGCHRS